VVCLFISDPPWIEHQHLPKAIPGCMFPFRAAIFRTGNRRRFQLLIWNGQHLTGFDLVGITELITVSVENFLILIAIPVKMF